MLGTRAPPANWPRLAKRGDLDEAAQVLRPLADAGNEDAAWHLAEPLADRGD